MMFSSSVSITASLVVLVLRRVAIADLDRPHLREVDELDRLDRERQVPARPGLRGLGVLAEAGDDAAAAFVDDVEAAREPDDDAPARRACPRRRAAAAARRPPPPSPASSPPLAAEQVVHAAVDVAPDLVEIGRSAAAMPRLPHWGSFSDMSETRSDTGRTRARLASGGRTRVRRRGRARRSQRRETATPAGNRSASAARKSAQPAPVNALKRTRRDCTTGVALDARRRGPAASILFRHADLRHVAPRRSPRAPRRRRRSARRDRRRAASMTCSSRSASAASASVARNAATRSCGRSRMKPTVSDSTIGVGARARGPGAAWCRAWRTAGRRRSALAPVSRLNSVDLPALV